MATRIDCPACSKAIDLPVLRKEWAEYRMLCKHCGVQIDLRIDRDRKEVEVHQWFRIWPVEVRAVHCVYRLEDDEGEVQKDGKRTT